jgi:beta-lactamase class A
VLDTARLLALARQHGLNEASIVVDDLDGTSGSILSLRTGVERQHYPASMIKLPIAMALAAFCRAGTLRLDDTVTVAAANLTANDAPSPFAAGVRAKLGDLARAMLSDSDNVATNVLIDVLGRDEITAACVAFGLQATAVRRKLSGALPLIADPAATGRNAHPASDAAALLAGLAEEAAREASWVYAALLAQRWNGKLAAGWAAGDRFAHKTGDTDEVSHDGGILTLPDGRRFVIVVYTSLPATAETDARFAAFARALRPRLGA